MGLNLRLRRARLNAGMSQKELARQSGISQQMISKLENGHAESTAEIFPLARALKVDPAWLATGQASASLSDVGASYNQEVPLVSWVAAGGWREMTDGPDVDAEVPKVKVTCRVHDRAFALRVRGDSMEPTFPNGCVIVIDPDVEARNGSYVVARLEDAQEATFKQLVQDGGMVFLKPLNPRYPLMSINQATVIVGVVRQMVMDFD